MRAPPRISQKDITMPYIRRLAAALKRSNEISRKDSTRMMRAGLTALLFWGVVIASFLVTPLPSVARELSLLVPGGTSMSDDSTSAPPTSGDSTTRYEPTRSASETSPLSTVKSSAVATPPPPPPPILFASGGYYVTQFGAGSHDGSLGNEWSVDEYNANPRPTAGDTVHFSGTITTTVRVATSGSSGNRLTLDMRGATLSTATEEPRIKLNGQNHVNIYGGTFAPASGGILIWSGDIPADNVTISGWTYTGNTDSVSAFAVVPQVTNCVIENNWADNISNFVVAYRSTTHHLTVRNNYARTSTNTTAQVDILFIADADTVMIEGNQLIMRAPGNYVTSHNDVIQTFQSLAMPSAPPSNWTIRYNWVEMNVPSGDGSVSWIMAEDLDQSVKIYGNVFLGQDSNATLGVNFDGTKSSVVVYFYNNTIIRKGYAPASGIRFLAPGTVHSRNNVVMSDMLNFDMTWTMNEGSDWNRNFFYNVYGPACSAQVTGANGSCGTNPQLRDFANNDFSLAATSPLIGAGDYTIGTEYNRGIAPAATWPNPALVERTTSWDAGAFVYNANAPVPPPPPPPVEEPAPIPAPVEPPPPAPVEEPAPAPDPVDSVPPEILSISVSNGTPSGVTIGWRTEGISTWVEYGTTGSTPGIAHADFKADGVYSVYLTGLAMNTTYYYRIRSVDQFGNGAVSGDKTFTTGFSLSNLGAVSTATDGLGAMVTGYARAAVTAGAAPSGLLIFTRRQGDLLVDEFAVPASPLMTSGRTLLEVSADGSVNTAISIANPNAEDAIINIEVRNSEGRMLRFGSLTVAGTNRACNIDGICTQLSRLLDEYPFSIGRGVEGTLTFTSTVPIAVSAYRVLRNERTPSDVLTTNQPIADLAVTAVDEAQVIPHRVMGNGVKTTLVLMNTTGRRIKGTVKFLDPSGAPVVVNNSSSSNAFSYSIAQNGSEKIELGDESDLGQLGSIWVVPFNNDPAPTAFAVFSYKPGSYTLSEGITPVTMGTAFRMYAEVEPSTRLSTTVAVANASSIAGLVTFSLTDLQGTFLASETRELAPSSTLVASIDSLLPSLAGRSFKGILRITTSLPNLAVAGFRERFNTRQPDPDYLFTSITPLRETGDPLQELVFSQLANGDGLTTQIILYSGTAGQTSEGTLRFMRQDGTPLPLDIR